jgi:hypothetical protein
VQEQKNRLSPVFFCATYKVKPAPPGYRPQSLRRVENREAFSTTEYPGQRATRSVVAVWNVMGSATLNPSYELPEQRWPPITPEQLFYPLAARQQGLIAPAFTDQLQANRKPIYDSRR